MNTHGQDVKMCLAGLQRFSLVALLCTYLHMYVGTSALLFVVLHILPTLPRIQIFHGLTGTRLTRSIYRHVSRLTIPYLTP